MEKLRKRGGGVVWRKRGRRVTVKYRLCERSASRKRKKQKLIMTISSTD